MEAMTKEMVQSMEKRSGGGPGIRLAYKDGVAAYAADAAAVFPLPDAAYETSSIAKPMDISVDMSTDRGIAFADAAYGTHEKSRAYEAVKRGYDIVFSLVALILLSPLFLVVSIAIKIEDGDPVIFRQLRTGKGGKEFWMYKFRSMCKAAPEMHGELHKDSESDSPFKLAEDPRITNVGKIMRRTSIDELPQLFNIIKGEMSIVGPRPLPTYEAKQCNSRQNRRLLVKPGLTCYWQVNGRSNIEFNERMELDCKYVKERNLLTDASLILRTFKAVISGDGAR